MMPGSGQKVTRARTGHRIGLFSALCEKTGKLRSRYEIQPSVMRRVPRSAIGRVTAQDAFHLILQVQLVLFQSNFFDLFGF